MPAAGPSPKPGEAPGLHDNALRQASVGQRRMHQAAAPQCRPKLLGAKNVDQGQMRRQRPQFGAAPLGAVRGRDDNRRPARAQQVTDSLEPGGGKTRAPRKPHEVETAPRQKMLHLVGQIRADDDLRVRCLGKQVPGTGRI